jgi:hypothetical protein
LHIGFGLFEATERVLGGAFRHEERRKVRIDGEASFRDAECFARAMGLGEIQALWHIGPDVVRRGRDSAVGLAHPEKGQNR